MGHDVTVLTLSDDDSRPRCEERDGYTLIHRSITAEVLGNGISVGVARHLRAATDYDVVHAHSHLYFSTNLAALKRRLNDTPLAITNHGLYSQSAPEWIFRWYLHTLGRVTFNSADTVFCYTEEDATRLREFGVNTGIRVVANGIDTDQFRPDGPESDRFNPNGLTLLFVGRLVDGKRPTDALAAVERLCESHPQVQLVFAGEGPLRAELAARAAEWDIDERVTFLRQVPYEEMPEVYRKTDLFVLPSRAEGLPRTVLEALASGMPVVTSALRQLVPIVEGVGRTVPVGDVAGFAGVLDELASAPDRCEEFGRRGRNLVTSEYSWNDTVARTTAHLEKLGETDC